MKKVKETVEFTFLRKEGGLFIYRYHFILTDGKDLKGEDCACVPGKHDDNLTGIIDFIENTMVPKGTV